MTATVAPTLQKQTASAINQAFGDTSPPSPRTPARGRGRPPKGECEEREPRDFDILPDSALVFVSDIAMLTGKHHSTVWRWVRGGNLPPSHKLASGTPFWLLGEIRRHLGI